VPCGASRQAVRRPELAGLADYGSCAAHPRWSGGRKRYLLTAAEGMPAAGCRADPATGARDAAAGLPGLAAIPEH
jgi:hypothetical protein